MKTYADLCTERANDVDLPCVTTLKEDVRELAKRLNEACERLRDIGGIVPLLSALVLAERLESIPED